MAIFKASYTKKRGGAKASIRYIEHRPGKDGNKKTRELFNNDGFITRQQAYSFIDEAGKGSVFFRFMISPDPAQEDTEAKDLHLPEITIQTMQALEQRIKRDVAWVAAEHNDHRPHRHVHIIAVVKGRLTPRDFEALRLSATEASLFQRHERDLARAAREQHAREWEVAQWGI